MVMLFDAIFQKYLDQRPVAVMTRAALEYAFAAPTLDAIFEQTAQQQYTHELTFSSVVALLQAVVFQQQPSVRSAYLHGCFDIPVSLSALYDKLNHSEPALAEALVQDTAWRLAEVAHCWTSPPQAVPGLQLKQLDGNYLAGSQHRLQELRGHGAAALPGMAVVLRDDSTGLLTNLIACQDAYTQERALVARVLAWVGPQQLWVADRNFAVDALLAGIKQRQAFYVIRYHAASKLQELTPLVAAGKTASGAVFEQQVQVGKTTCRSVVLRLHKPTSAGETEIRLLTNLSAEQASAPVVAEVYGRRWRIEGSFLELTTSLRCELDTLGYPKAALLAFAVAVCACNVLRVVCRALEQASQTATASSEATKSEELWQASSYAVAVELRTAYDGLVMNVPAGVWQRFRLCSAAELARWMVQVANRADRRRYQKSKRGPKKAVEQVKAGRKAPHRSTFRLLQQRAKPPNPSPRP
jgi:IS4 transposase